ncbi:hypothetical protein [Thalassotalea mangrovi]|uniref:Uncharacterized protein n=1 Tax=Thalassotalea mangrovi TaxID=2572245 RepID=A0A4U1B4B3_9GAMM|nr:hypothetical protein [Thalassotalea mangrovi]TKB44526.1 hypothetical protein E8M12_11595 [Thalassotalea mangrovi]
MSLNRKQFDYLQAMGISIWSAREEKFASLDGNEDNPQIVDQSDKILAELNTLSSHPPRSRKKQEQPRSSKLSLVQQYQACIDSRWFSDLLVWLAIDKTEVDVSEQGLRFGNFLWKFDRQSTIRFGDNTIKSPSFATRQPSAEQKRQLFLWFRDSKQG